MKIFRLYLNFLRTVLYLYVKEGQTIGEVRDKFRTSSNPEHPLQQIIEKNQYFYKEFDKKSECFLELWRKLRTFAATRGGKVEVSLPIYKEKTDRQGY